MKSIDLLRSEHRDLESMLAVLEAAALCLRGGGSVRADLLSCALAFFEGFGAICHHAKEEALLFPLRSGLGSDICFVAALQAQHEIDRAYLLEIKEAVERLASHDIASGPRLSIVLLEYVQLVKEHIRIEESYFDRLAETISAADDARLVERFQAMDGHSV